ncbi:MAG: response regulator transcription factor [Anaerolineales bacterium]
MIEVILADDHKLVRDGLQAILDREGDINVVGEAGDGRAVIRQCRRLKPDVILLDISMPGMSGIDAARKVLDTCPGVEVVILSMHSTKEHIYQALKAGARGFLRKETAGVEVADAIRAVSRGERYLCKDVTERVVEDYVQKREGGKTQDPLQDLSPREREVMNLVVEGMTNQEIAETLHLAPSTVSTYRSRLMKKLDVDNVPDLVKLALKHR